MKQQPNTDKDYDFSSHLNMDQTLSPVDMSKLGTNQSLFSKENLSVMAKSNGVMNENQTDDVVSNVGNNDKATHRIEFMKKSMDGSGDSLKESYSKACSDLNTATSVTDHGFSEDAVNSVITSLNQLTFSTTQSVLSNTSSAVWSPGEDELNRTHNGLLQMQSGMSCPPNQPQNCHTRRAITGQHTPSTLNGHPLQHFNNVKYPIWSNGTPQSQPVRRFAQNGHLNSQQPLGTQFSGFSQQRRGIPYSNQLAINGQFVKAFGNKMHGVNPCLIPSSNLQTSKFHQGAQYPVQYQQGINISGLDESQQALLALQTRLNGAGDSAGLQKQFDAQMLESLRNTEHHISPHEQLKGWKIKRKAKSPFGLADVSLHDADRLHLFHEGATSRNFANHNGGAGGDQTVPQLNGYGAPLGAGHSPSAGSAQHGSPNNAIAAAIMNRFSRKVFVGGLPPDIDEEEITAAFRRFGQLVVDWPHKAESKSYFPPKGYCFLIFQDEMSVHQLVASCVTDDTKMYWCVSSPTMKDKPVQIRPWCLSDSDFVLDGSQALDPRKTIFVGGVPRPLRAVELALIMDRLYGGVCYAGIDTDPELKYPKGAGRVAFSNQQSYITAISARFVQLQHGDIDKRVEVKPYVLDDQLCDECQGARCGGKFAPFFCANVACLQYYCESCWGTIHAHPGREFHKPLVKEGSDRPRTVPFRWC